MTYHAYVRQIAEEVHHALRDATGDQDAPEAILPTIHARIASSERWTTCKGACATLVASNQQRPYLSESTVKFAAHAALIADIAALVYALVDE